jgi:glycosyltransferase involved in cell wall biosynthesis
LTTLKLTIISHTEHYQTDDGTIVGWGPTISEINHLAKDFEEIYHVAFLHQVKEIPPSSLPYTASNVHFVPLRPVGGPGILNKIRVLGSIPSVIATVRKTLKKTDVFQLRTPTGIGVYLIPYLTLFSNKKGWYKYAGNWAQENPPLGYRLQRAMLKKQKRKVTINGKWPGQPAHCYTFENPCLTLAEHKEGAEITRNKTFKPPFTFCFVGRLEDAKGVQRILDALTATENRSFIKEVHLVGDGPKKEVYKSQVEKHRLPVRFHGFLEREKVFELYKQAHFFMLPSDSEGFPKVIAEAANFGCIPMVSEVSSIGQYVNSENGYLITPCTSEKIHELLIQISKTPENEFINKASEIYKIANSFTFAHYRHRILTEILN